MGRPTATKTILEARASLLSGLRSFFEARQSLPNLQNVKFFSKTLDKFISMKVSVHALKSVEKNGGLDDYLKKTSNRVLAPEALAIKKSILKTTKSTAQDS